jgi:hypothetical protein
VLSQRSRYVPTPRRVIITFTVSPVEFVPGRPNVYGLFHPNVNGWYIGKNETGDAAYMGSPSEAVRAAIVDAHREAGLPVVVEKHILWSPPGATVQQCRDQEWFWIARFRAGHGGPVFNLFPIRDWSDHFRWEHDPLTHVDRATNSRWPVVYIKLQADPDAAGNCNRKTCGQPWGAQVRGLRWCAVIDERGRQVSLLEPSPRGNPYQAYRRHRLEMFRKGGC